MIRRCEVSGVDFGVEDEDLAFYKRVSPVVGGTRLEIPAPRLSPDERQRRRLAFRNERFLYRRKCAISGRDIVSAYSPDISLKVCGKAEWLELDNTQFGRPYDLNRSFFEQFAELRRDTYKCAVIQDGEMQNSEYTHFCGWLKNCYWLFDSGKSEDCSYGVFVGYCKDTIDGLFNYRSELCYNSVRIENCYELFFSQYCNNCHTSAFLDNCIGCSHCLASANLRNKEYYVFNEYVGKAKFEEIWKATFNGTFAAQEGIRRRFGELLLTVPHRNLRNINCENCSGDDLSRCSNVQHSYNAVESRDCKYCYDIFSKTTDCYDIGSFGESMQYSYEASGCGGALGKSELSNCFFSAYIFYGGYNILYSMNCHENSQNLFGCSDLRRKQFCILNKQYSEAEYNALVPYIVDDMKKRGEWGEFFPISMSPFGYNQTLAHEFYPLERNEVERFGAHWSDYESPLADVKTVIAASELPKTSGASPDLKNTAIKCEATGKLFRITEGELKFYSRYGLALPHYHPEERQRRRFALLNPRKLYTRICAKTGEEMLTSYPPDSPLIVYSENEFQLAAE